MINDMRNIPPSKIRDLMKKREAMVGDMLDYLKKWSSGFTNPKMILIGGYALRHFIPEGRFSKDCDFVMEKKNGFWIDRIRAKEDISIEALEKHETYGFLKLAKSFDFSGIKILSTADIMEGEIRGRNKREIVKIDSKFVNSSSKAEIQIVDKFYKVSVPEYRDYLIAKVVAMRKRDIRDIALLITSNGVPEKLTERINELCPHPGIFMEKIEISLERIRAKDFIDNVRGAFPITTFTEDDKNTVINELENLIKQQK